MKDVQIAGASEAEAQDQPNQPIIVDGVELTQADWDALYGDDGKETRIVNLTKGDTAEPITHYSFFVVVRTPPNHYQYKGKTLQGSFEAKIATYKDTLAISRTKAFLRGGLPAQSFDAIGSMLIDQQASLQNLLTKHPSWFSIEDTSLLDLVGEIYDFMLERDNFFRGA